ncbi:hypothetical protein EFR01_52320 [Sinorhizobium fredii]|nr:hypothetical protein EFR01_52320 [Sinorhizobium fredii]GLS12430.1 hypothetical protein GCM10007864_60630 [Sinorhizobium fredii]
MSSHGCGRIFPLWPAGHLPHKGETAGRMPLAPAATLLSAKRIGGCVDCATSFLPLVGEMARQASGGITHASLPSVRPHNDKRRHHEQYRQ